MKDQRIRRRPAERQAIVDNRARCFCLSDGNIGYQTMAERYVSNWAAIVAACVEAGPFLYSVRAKEIARLDVST